MLKILYKCVDRIGNSQKILILSPSFRSFGNSTEEIFFALLHCIDKDKKLLLMKPFDRFFFKKVNIGNKYLYQMDHELIIKPSFFINLLCSSMMTALAGCGFIISKFRELLARIFNLPEPFYKNRIDLSYYFGRNHLFSFSEEQIYSKKEWMELAEKYSVRRSA